MILMGLGLWIKANVGMVGAIACFLSGRLRLMNRPIGYLGIAIYRLSRSSSSLDAMP
jgi:hypothetical protein